MIKKIFVALILVVNFNAMSFGQNKKEVRLNILNPGIAFENPIGKKTTVEYNFGIG